MSKAILQAWARALGGDQFSPALHAIDGSAIDFHTINRAALATLPAILARIVPGGKTILANMWP